MIAPLHSASHQADISDDRQRNPARRLYHRSWAALAFIAGLLVLHQLLLQPSLSRLTSDAPVINVSGRQRMLSQRLSKAALALESASDAAEARQRRAELVATVTEWTRGHRGLQRGDADLRLPGANSPPVQRLFAELEPHFDAIVHAAQSLLASNPEQADEPALEARRTAVKTILQHEPEFLTRMHAIVGLYESEARRRVQQLQVLGLVIMAAILLLLVCVQLVVMRPAIQFVGREFEQSEEQYRRLVESMNDGVIVYDQLGRVQFANRRFGEIVGYTVTELVGKPVSIFVADSDRRRFDLLQQSGNGRPGPVEIALRHQDGRTMETLASPRPLFDLDGSPQGQLLVLTDMTARKQAEARGRELLDQLAHADRLKSMGELTASLAHEINQPLGAIANFAEGCLAQLSGDDPDPRELQEPLERIRKAALRGGEIIRRTRSFAQHRPHTVAEVSINDLVREVEELMLPEARRRSVLMNFQLAPKLPRLSADAIQIQQVLTNLMQNAFDALEATPAYRRRLTVRTSTVGWASPTTNVDDTEELVGTAHPTNADFDAIEVCVIDNGPGFSIADPERLFEPFVTTRAEGTGMGLPISRSIVEAHGGRIWADRHAEGGAAFRFTLPLEPPAIDTLPALAGPLEMAHG